VIAAVERLGDRTIDAVERTGELARLAGHTVRVTVKPPFRLRAFVYQVYAQGVRALGLATAASLFAGMAMAVQFGIGLRRFGAISLLSQLTALALVRELVPVFAGLVIGSRLAAGIAAELASMAVTEQLDAVRVLGADPVRELVVPRVVAATIVLPLITVFGDGIATLGAMFIAKVEYNQGAAYFVESLRGFITVSDYTSGIAKSAVFGLMTGFVGCWHGLRARGGTEGVGRATTRSVVDGSLAVIIANYFLARLLLGWLSGET
jgi:phospholipid/cholesterol/gamma-HCH transport system permease protein